jgi:hypothetical protein
MHLPTSQPVSCEPWNQDPLYCQELEIKDTEMSWAAPIGQTRNINRILVGKLLGKRPLE